MILGFGRHDFDFFKLEPKEWTKFTKYNKLKKIIDSITLSNDPAERCVRLFTLYGDNYRDENTNKQYSLQWRRIEKKLEMKRVARKKPFRMLLIILENGE